jgi:hypothetical protein
MVERDGTITQHAPISRATFHGGSGHNSRSIGLECVSPYYGSRAKSKDLVIDAKWAHRKRYILPKLEQAEAVFKLTRWLSVEHDIPLAFPCVDDEAGVFKWGRNKDGAQGAGVIAHHRWHHADGLFFEHYCAVRSLRGLSAEDAFKATVLAASAMKRRTKLPEGETG